jgi:hypothetical protein
MYRIYSTKSFSRALILFVSVFVIFAASDAFSQGTSNEGTDFWVAYAGHVDGTGSRLTLFITSKVNATVNIDLGGIN